MADGTIPLHVPVTLRDPEGIIIVSPWSGRCPAAGPTQRVSVLVNVADLKDSGLTVVVEAGYGQDVEFHRAVAPDGPTEIFIFGQVPRRRGGLYATFFISPLAAVESVQLAFLAHLAEYNPHCVHACASGLYVYRGTYEPRFVAAQRAPGVSNTPSPLPSSAARSRAQSRLPLGRKRVWSCERSGGDGQCGGRAGAGGQGGTQRPPSLAASTGVLESTASRSTVPSVATRNTSSLPKVTEDEGAVGVGQAQREQIASESEEARDGGADGFRQMGHGQGDRSPDKVKRDEVPAVLCVKGGRASFAHKTATGIGALGVEKNSLHDQVGRALKAVDDDEGTGVAQEVLSIAQQFHVTQCFGGMSHCNLFCTLTLYLMLSHVLDFGGAL